MSKQPTTCRYCDGHGNSTAGGPCGFCENGTPLDTQTDWDNTWGTITQRGKMIQQQIFAENRKQGIVRWGRTKPRPGFEPPIPQTWFFVSGNDQEMLLLHRSNVDIIIHHL